MPKQKNHTGRNATVKAHANGIKKALSYRASSLKGVSFRSQVVERMFTAKYLSPLFINYSARN